MQLAGRAFQALSGRVLQPSSQRASVATQATMAGALVRVQVRPERAAAQPRHRGRGRRGRCVRRAPRHAAPRPHGTPHAAPPAARHACAHGARTRRPLPA
jgi:hypothetical protein